MARVTGLGHVGIYVRDLERMVAFYRDVMGMLAFGEVVFLELDLGGRLGPGAGWGWLWSCRTW